MHLICFKNVWSKLMSLSIVPGENNKLENWLFIDLISWNIFKIYIYIEQNKNSRNYLFSNLLRNILCRYFLLKKIWYLFLLSKHLQVIFSLISRYIIIFLAPTSTCKDCISWILVKQSGLLRDTPPRGLGWCEFTNLHYVFKRHYASVLPRWTKENRNTRT